MKTSIVIATVAALFLAGCAGSSYKPVQNMTTLDLSFADSAWNGKKVPSGQQCRRFGGRNPSTPSITVTNVPPNTNAIIISFSDASHGPMNNGGHGKIGYEVSDGSTAVTVPSVPGHSFDLPAGFFLVSAQRNPSWDVAGAYLPPCSGGQGNSYYATVKAVQRPINEGDEALLLGEGVIKLGRY